jgi:hypothetical protein
MARGKRLFLAVLSAVLLMSATAAPISVFALGETQVTLSCSDGSETKLTVDAATLLELKDAVEAMTLYPAGLSCSLAEVPLLGSFGMGLAFADNGQTDFVVGGGQRALFCNTNIAINGHRRGDDSNDAWGVVNESIPGGQAYPCEGIIRTTVVCADMNSTGQAVVVSKITRSTGVFDDFGYDPDNYVRWFFRDNGTGIPDDYGNDGPFATQPACTGATYFDFLARGNILVKLHGS